MYALSISMDLLTGLRSVGFVTGADILASCIAGGLVIGGDVAVGVVRLARIADGVCWLLLCGVEHQQHQGGVDVAEYEQQQPVHRERRQSPG